MSSQGVVYENIVQGGEGGCAPNVANLGTQRTWGGLPKVSPGAYT